MTDKERAPRDIRNAPASGSEGDAAKDFEPVADKAEGAAHSAEDAGAERGYEPKHRAPGRAPLIRRRRSTGGDEETVSWETSWTPPEERTATRWTDEEEPSITPPPPPIEVLPYLEPRRSEQRGPDEDFAPAEAEAEAEAEAPVGPRRAALEQRKKKKRVLQTMVGALALAVAIAGLVGAGLLVKEAVEDPRQRTAVPFQPPEEEEVGGTTLVFGTKEKADPSRAAIWIVLLTVDPETEEASIVYVPSHTAVEVPGRGLQGVGEAYGSGGVPLLLVSAENLLGINIDRYMELSDKDAQVLFEQFETLTVDVPAEVRVPAGKDQARLIFVEGPQEMTPSSLVRLLYTMGLDGDDVELGSRHLAFWDELLEVYDDPAELAAAFEAAGAALGESDASPKQHAAFIELLASVPSEDVTLTALPVRPISAGDSQLYSVDAEELTAFVDETIGTGDETEQEIRVQLLNGNGVPGIGREAAAKLVGEGFRVILGGNARRLDYRKTLVIAYDSSERGIDLAERARELLGVGEVQVSAQEQGIVDLTIVVGKDFLRAR